MLGMSLSARDRLGHSRAERAWSKKGGNAPALLDP